METANEIIMAIALLGAVGGLVAMKIIDRRFKRAMREFDRSRRK